MKDAVIVGAARTAVGKFGGGLAGIQAGDLGVTAAKAAMERAGVTPDQVDELIFGNVLSAGLGQNVARQVALKSGMPQDRTAFAVNKVCGSGLKSVMLAAQAIKADDADIIVAGGTENMSASPYLIDKGRWGHRLGHGSLTDHMIKDGLWDVYNDYHMGVTAENIAEKFNLTREEQDQLAVTSQNRAEEAIKSGRFKDEIVPVTIKGRKGDVVIDTDEHPRYGATMEAMAKLKPAFKKDGTVTAGNASGLNDAAAAVVVTSADKAAELGLKPMAKIRAYAAGGVDPAIMGTGPIEAVTRAMKKADLTVADMELIEANEAFAAQALSVIKTLKFNTDIVNVNGGAIALGHPIGCSGTRILVTLLFEMIKRDVKMGLATLCIGGGMGVAMIVER